MSRNPSLPLGLAHEVRDACLCLHAQRAARVIARRYDAALQPFGLTNGQFSLLMSLHRVRPPSIGDVAALLGADRTTITASLKPLVRTGLVRTRRDRSDARCRRLVLTAAGRRRLGEAMPAWRRAQRDTPGVTARMALAALRALV